MKIACTHDTSDFYHDSQILTHSRSKTLTQYLPCANYVLDICLLATVAGSSPVESGINDKLCVQAINSLVQQPEGQLGEIVTYLY